VTGDNTTYGITTAMKMADKLNRINPSCDECDIRVAIEVRSKLGDDISKESQSTAQTIYAVKTASA
jgi:hypothetical protein